MPARTDVDALARLDDDEINQRIRDAMTRIEDRGNRAQAENRLFTGRETDLNADDMAELGALREACAIKDHEQRMRGAISDAMQTRAAASRLSPLAVSADNLRALEDARRDYRSLSVIEQRAALATTDMGTAVEYAANGLAAPATLWRSAAIPTSEPPLGLKGTVPQFTLPAAVALVGEGLAHAEFTGVDPDPVTLARTGAWSDLTSEAFISSSLAEISAAHARVIARDIDKATVAKVEQTPSVMSIDEALTTTAAEAAVDVSRLWIVGTPASVAELAGNATFAATNASDVGSYASSYGSARLYATPTATADQLTVFWPGGFRVFATALASGVVVDPTTGSQRFGQWQLFGIGQSLVGGAITIALSGSL